MKKGKRHRVFRIVSGLILGILFLFLYPKSAHSQKIQPPEDPNYYQIIAVHSAVTQEKAFSNTELDPLENHPCPGSVVLPEADPFISLGVGPLTIVSGIIKLWEIIQDNKAVVKTNFKGASALPEAAEGEWTKITGWKPEHSLIYAYEALNTYHQKVFDLKYKVSLRYGGSFKGKGRYIASARILPIHIQVFPGFKLSVDVKVVSTENSGTEDEPIAAVRLHIVEKMKSLLRQTTEKQSFFLKGDGYIEDRETAKIYFESPSEVPQSF